MPGRVGSGVCLALPNSSISSSSSSVRSIKRLDAELEGAGTAAFATGAAAATVFPLGASALAVTEAELGATIAAPLRAPAVECTDDDDDNAGTVLAFFAFSAGCCVVVLRTAAGLGAPFKAAMYIAVSFALTAFLVVTFALFLLS
jgi:hypothetical protein